MNNNNKNVYIIAYLQLYINASFFAVYRLLLLLLGIVFTYAQ